MKYRNSPPQGLDALIPWVGTRGGDFFQSNLLMRGSRNFVWGGGGGGVGVPDQSDIKKKKKKKKKTNTLTVFFCCFVVFFLVHSLFFYRNGQFHRNLSFFKVPEEVQHFPVGGRGVQLFLGGGSNCLFPIETHITCDFAGVRTPCPPPLLIRTCSLFFPPALGIFIALHLITPD